MSTRYEIKRGLNFTEIPEDAVQGSVGFILKGFDIEKFGGSALFENWEGVVATTDFYAAAINTASYHNNGAVWRAAGDTAVDGIADLIGNYVAVNSGTTSGNATILGAAKPFYANRHDTWGGDAKGLVFETLANICSTTGMVFDAFIGLVNSATPQAVIDDLESGAQTSTVKRIGFAHAIAGGTNNCILTIAANGSSQVSVGTTTLASQAAVSTTAHYKIVYNFESRDAEYTSLGTSIGPSIDFYINDTLVRSETTAKYMISGEVPLYPYFYIEQGAAYTSGLDLLVYGVNSYYI